MLRLENISFAYTPDITVLKQISFTIKSGQHVALIGASGCGKSTLLKIIYGLLHVAQGSLFWKDKPLLGPLYNLVPGEECMKYVSQGFELLSYRTVRENIGQYLSNFEPELKQERVDELLEIVEMVDFANVKVENLSGGQKQRVALANALAKKPELLLLDEPFGNIDNYRRSALRRNLFRFLKRNGITCITATHDKTDILSFTDETIVIQEGQILTQTNTKDLYHNPPNHYVASLFGEVNELDIHLFDKNRSGKILLYPHQIQITQEALIRARVKNSYFNGNHYLVEAILQHQVIFIEHSTVLSENEMVGIAINK